MKVPKDWIVTELGQVAEVVTGSTPSRKVSNYYGGSIPWVKPPDINSGREVVSSDEYLSEEGATKARLLPKGAVMVTCIGNIGNVAIAGTQLATNQQINSIVVDDRKILPKYVYYQALTWKEWLYDNSTSTTISMINKSRFSRAPFLLAPLPDQKRIVAKLDILFAHLDQLKSRLDKIPVLLKQFRQAVLTQAVTGKLTHSKYELKTLGAFKVEIQTGPFGSALHKEDYIEGGVSVINPSHIFDGKIVPDISVSINKAKLAELGSWILNDGDIVLGRRGEMGRAAKYNASTGPMICGTGSLILRKNPLIEPDFLSLHLRSSFSVQFLEENAVGSTMVNLNQRVITSLPFPSISLEEQREIVRKVNSVLAFVDQIEERYQELKEKIDHLPQKILLTAFNETLSKSLEKRIETNDKDLRKALAFAIGSKD